MNVQTLIDGAGPTEDLGQSMIKGKAVSKAFSFFSGSGLLDLASEHEAKGI